MKFIISTLLTALLAFAAGLYLPWWSIAVASFLVAVSIYQRPFVAFLTGFAGLFLLWLLLVWGIDAANDSVLAERISAVMGFGDSPLMLMLITCSIGGITGGLGALTGSLARSVRPER